MSTTTSTAVRPAPAVEQRAAAIGPRAAAVGPVAAAMAALAAALLGCGASAEPVDHAAGETLQANGIAYTRLIEGGDAIRALLLDQDRREIGSVVLVDGEDRAALELDWQGTTSNLAVESDALVLAWRGTELRFAAGQLPAEGSDLEPAWRRISVSLALLDELHPVEPLPDDEIYARGCPGEHSHYVAKRVCNDQGDHIAYAECENRIENELYDDHDCQKVNIVIACYGGCCYGAGRGAECCQ